MLPSMNARASLAPTMTTSRGAPPGAGARLRTPHPAPVIQRQVASGQRPALGGHPGRVPRLAGVVQRMPAPPGLAPALRVPRNVRGRELRGRGVVLTPQSYLTLDTSQRYLWAVRESAVANVLEIAVALRGTDTFGHPTLAYVGAPGQGAFRRVLIAGEMRYARGIIGNSGWILDNESGRLGRLPAPANTRAALQFTLDLFKHETGAVAYGDLLSGWALNRNLQLLRRDWSGWGTNWLSTGYMVSSNLTWPETLRRWASIGFPAGVAAYYLGGLLS
jgi:hypothetical protein